MQQLSQTSPPKAQQPLFSKQPLFVRGVGCNNEVNDDDGDNSPDSGAGLGAVMTAEARRPRAAALVAIVLSLNGVKPALLHACFSQFAPSSDAAFFSPAALCLPLSSALT
jgi:hypothetical protein